MIKIHKNKIISETKNDDQNALENKDLNYDKEIRNIFNKNKINNSENINIKNFFEKLNEQKVENKYNNINQNYKNIKKELNEGDSTFNINKINNSFIKNNRNINKIIYKKDYLFNKTNNILYKKKKEFEEKKINKYNSLNNYIKGSKNDVNKTEKEKTSISCINYKNKEIEFNDNLFIANNNKVQIQNYNQLYPKRNEFPFPKITKNAREKNKNSDIIDLI